MAALTIVGIGEVLWDLLPQGPRFGGAPANFACHAAALGAAAAVVSCVGEDELGEQAVAALAARGIDPRYIARTGRRPTGSVQVALDAAGKPTFTIGADAAWDLVEWSDELGALAARTDAVCFGTLGQRHPTARGTIQRFVAAVPPGALRIFDINLRPPYIDPEIVRASLALATVLKLNDEELEVLAPMLGLREPETIARLREIAHAHALGVVALTCGERGAVLVRGDEVSQWCPPAARVRDSIGAGDSFTAAMAMGLLRGHDLEAINRHACQVASYVCSQPGATPALPRELL